MKDRFYRLHNFPHEIGLSIVGRLSCIFVSDPMIIKWFFGKFGALKCA